MKKKLLTLFSLGAAVCLLGGLAACNVIKKDPSTLEHTHEYTQWEHDGTQHWKVCPEDGALDPAGKSAHDFTKGDCVCGQKKPSSGTTGDEENPDVTPDADLDTREFWVVGSGAGTLKNCSFTELRSNFQLKKQPQKDGNGYTVYTSPELTLYAGDTLKVVQDLDWDEGLGYFGISDVKNNNGTFVDGGLGNISPAAGKDGKYTFTVRTKPDIAFSQCTLEYTLVEPVEALKNTEEIYIVGSLHYCNTQWPDGGKPTGCQKLDYDEATGEWSIVLRMGGYMEGSTLPKYDTFKLFNAVNGSYIPDGVNNNKLVGGSEDHTDPTTKQEYKASGDYKISWKKGDADVTFTKLEHTHVFDRTVSDADQHWTVCWLDDTEKPDTAHENHVWENEQDTKCDVCGKTRHVHNYDTWDWDEEEHWKYCDDHGTDKSNIDETTRKGHTIDPETHLCECGYEQHTHTFEWTHDAKQHWKVCPKDNEPDPDTPKAPHSFDPVTHTCVCGYEHTHEYTKYNYTDDEHWKECPTEGVIDETTRTAHDFTNGDCVCGKGKPDCDHSNGYAFAYEELPAAEADGGTLEKICPDCKGKQPVPYLKGFTGDATSSSTAGTVGDISEAGTYYFSTGDKWQTLGMKITEAGTYTLTFEEVCDLNEIGANLRLAGLTFGTQYATTFGRGVNSLVYSGGVTLGNSVTSKSDIKKQIETYAVKINGNTLNATNVQDGTGTLTTLSFTVTADQLSSGDLYVTIQLVGYIPAVERYEGFAAENSLSHLVTVTKSAAASISAPAEVALLPGGKND